MGLLGDAWDKAKGVVTDNPLTGTYDAAKDLVNGDTSGAAKDFGNGATYGTLAPVADKAQDAANGVKGAFTVNDPSLSPEGQASLDAARTKLVQLQGQATDVTRAPPTISGTTAAGTTIATPTTMQAAQVGSTPQVNAARVQGVSPAIAQQAAAAQVRAPTTAAYQMLAPASQALVEQMNAAKVGQMQTVQGAQIDPAAMARAQQALAAQMQLDPQAQIRQGQLSTIQALQARANGQGVSPAEMLLQRQTESNIANQFALAHGAAPGGVNMALRDAMGNASNLNSKAAADAAMLRAQEQDQANVRLLGALSDTRGADIGVAGTQAGFQQQANLQNAQLGTQTNLANQNALNTRSLNLAQFGQQANLANQAALNQGTLTQAQLQQAANSQNAGAYNTAYLADQSAENQQKLAQANLNQDTSKFNAGAYNTTGLAQAQLDQGANLQNAQLGTQVGLANMSTDADINKANAQLLQQAGISNADRTQQGNLAQAQLTQGANQFNAAATNTAGLTQAQLDQALNTFNAGQQNDISKANGDAALKQTSLDDAKYQASVDALLKGQQQIIGADQNQEQLSYEADKVRALMAAGLTQAAAETLVGGVKSLAVPGAPVQV